MEMNMFRILLVDDEPEIVDSLEAMLLKNCRYTLEIDKAYLPNQAISLASVNTYDILLTDMRMPRMTGLEMAERITKFSHNKKIRIIFLTGYSDFECLYKVIKDGYTNYILKNESDEELVKLLEKCIDEIPAEQLVERMEPSENSDRIVENCKQYILENLNKDLSLNAIADRVNMNPSYFSRLFKKKTGENISQYIQKVRIEKAKEMIESGNRKIVEIGEILGFESAAYFTTYFKHATGYTPQSYKEACIAKRIDKK